MFSSTIANEVTEQEKTNYLFEIGMAVVRTSTGTDKLRSQNEPKDLIVMENNGRGKH